jgi:serpin B
MIKKAVTIICICLLCVCAVSCSRGVITDGGGARLRALTDISDIIVLRGTPAADPNDFAFRLASVLAQGVGNENMVFSPFSVWLPLAALTEAADQRYRREQMESIGVYGMGSEELKHSAERLLSRLTGEGGTLRIANAVFVDNGAAINRTFADMFGKYFGGEVMNVDFTSQSAVERVNKWASDNTDGLINNIIGQFDPNTVAAIANAIYFTDDWQTKFQEAATRRDTFHSPVGETAAYFMPRTATMRYDCLRYRI